MKYLPQAIENKARNYEDKQATKMQSGQMQGLRELSTKFRDKAEKEVINPAWRLRLSQNILQKS